MEREDTYESIRQLIDDIDSMKNIIFVYGFDRALLDDENTGIKSYQALWMRIQNEIRGERFNRFTDIVDMDRMAVQEYTSEVIMEISRYLAGKQNNIRPLNQEEAAMILEKSRSASVGIPQLIQEAMGGKKENV